MNLTTGQIDWIKNGNTVFPYITATLMTSEVIEIDPDDVVENSVTVDSNCSNSKTIEIGNANISELRFQLFNSAKFTGKKLEGATLNVVLDIAGDLVQLGIFIVDERPRNDIILNIRALDRRARFSKPYDSTLVFPATLQQIMIDACTNCGVSLLSTTFPNHGFVVANKPDDIDLTYHTMVSWVAELAACNVDVTNNGLIELKQYPEQDINTVKINPTETFELEVAESDITINGVKYESGDDVYLAGNDGYVIDLSGNGLVQDKAVEALTFIGSQIVGLTYRPITKLSCLGFPQFGPMSGIIIDTDEGEKYSIITSHLYKLNSSEFKSAGESETKAGYASLGSLSPKQKSIIKSYALKAAETASSSVEVELINLNEQITNALGYYSTIIEQEDGSKITYNHDAPTLEGSQYIDVKTEAGFAWTNSGWNDGDPVWTYGVTKEGSLIMRLISVVGLNASWINAGIIAAERISIGSTSSFATGYNPAEKETPSGAQSKADAVQSNIDMPTYSDLKVKTEMIHSVGSEPYDESVLDLEIKGQTLTNLVTNGDFSGGTSGWSFFRLDTTSASSNTLNALSNFVGASPVYVYKDNISSAIGDKLYISADMLYGLATTARITLFDNGAFTGIAATANTSLTSNVFSRVSGVLTATRTNNRLALTIDSTTDNTTVKMKQIIAINLTAMYGAGNEPTAAQMYLIAPTWFGGTVNVVNPELVNAGKNLCDNSKNKNEEVNVNTGAISPNSTVVTSDYIRIDGKIISLSEKNGKAVTTRYFDSNKSYLGTTFSTMASYVKARHYTSAGILPSEVFFQVELGSTATPYEPYKSNTLALTGTLRSVLDASVLYRDRLYNDSGTWKIDRYVNPSTGLKQAMVTEDANVTGIPYIYKNGTMYYNTTVIAPVTEYTYATNFRAYKDSRDGIVEGLVGTTGLIEKAKLGSTVIQGGLINTELLTADNIITGKLMKISGKTYFDLDNDEIKMSATIGGVAVVITINPTVGFQVTAGGVVVGGLSPDGYLSSSFVTQSGASPTSRLSIGSETIGAYSGFGLTLSNLISAVWTKVASLASFSFGASWVTQLTGRDGTNHVRMLRGESTNLYASNSAGTASFTFVLGYNQLLVYNGGTEIFSINSAGVISSSGGIANETINASSPEAITLISSFTNSWVNHGFPHSSAGYYKDRDRVYLSGAIKSGTNSLSAFTLPTGYRPGTTRRYPVIANNAFGYVTVNADGTVVPTVATSSAVNLDSISFRI